jgi:hypothetical protein
MCENAELHEYFQEMYPGVWAQLANGIDVERAAYCMRMICGVESRAELDSNQTAAGLFHAVMRSFNNWRAA